MHALCVARKCSVWTGGSILSSASTFQWSSTHDYDESGPQCGGLRSVTQTGIWATVWLVFLSFSFSSRHLDSPNAAGPWPMRQLSARRFLRSDAFGMSLILLPFLLFCALFPFSRFDALEIKCCFSTNPDFPGCPAEASLDSCLPLFSCTLNLIHFPAKLYFTVREVEVVRWSLRVGHRVQREVEAAYPVVVMAS